MLCGGLIFLSTITLPNNKLFPWSTSLFLLQTNFNPGVYCRLYSLPSILPILQIELSHKSLIGKRNSKIQCKYWNKYKLGSHSGWNLNRNWQDLEVYSQDETKTVIKTQKVEPLYIFSIFYLTLNRVVC